MNKKLLFAAALPLVFTACSNELENVATEEQQNPTEIVGARLVGNGLTIEVNRGDVTSRLAKGEFEDGDEMGLAWYKSALASSISAVQIGNGFDWTSYKVGRDHFVYGNHKFIKNGDWSTQANVYEGFHFAYYPYSYMSQIGQITIAPNAEAQKGSFDDEQYNKAFWISAQDTILATAVTAEGTVSKKIDLVRAVNVLKFNLTPAEPFSTAEALKDLNITGVEIQTGGADPMFYTTAAIQPSYLPYAVYEDEDEDGVYTYNSKATTDKINAKIYDTTGKTAVKLANEAVSMKTEVAEEAGLVLGETSSVRMFLLPTKDVELGEGGLAIHVYVPGGYFRIYSNSTEDNVEALDKLRALLSKDGFYSEVTKETYKLSELNYKNVAINLDLVAADFTPDFSSISDITEWNGAVAIADALGMKNPTFTVDGVVSIESAEEFKVPANGVTVETAGEGKLVVDGDMTWPENLTATKTVNNITSYAKVEIAKNATLTIEDGVVLDADVVNKGTVKLGYKSEIKTVDNTDGRIEVIYGSYVTATENAAGVIAYEITGNESAAKLNELTSSENTLGNVHVNTLVVGNGITFNLSMKDGIDVNDNPYNGEDGGGSTLKRMAETNFELNDGTIVANVNADVTVNNVEVIGGDNNEIWNISIAGDLTVTEGEVVVDADTTDDYKRNITADAINVKSGAELTSNVNIYVENISIPAGAKTTVNSLYTIWYTGVYTQGGSTTGSILKASWDGVADEPASTVEGRVTVYTVNTPDELVWLAQQNKVNTAKIVLGGNINMSGVNWTKGIHAGDGDQETTVDGQGYSILNLNGAGGLLSYAVGSIKNLTINGANIGSGTFAGALADNCYASIENVTVKNVTVQGTKRVGAIVGIHNGGSIKNSTVENATISGDCYSAGVISGMVNESVNNRVYENCTIKNSTVNADLKGALTGVVNVVTLTVKNIKMTNTTPTDLVGGFYGGGKLIEE